MLYSIGLEYRIHWVEWQNKKKIGVSCEVGNGHYTTVQPITEYVNKKMIYRGI
jgi:hypothetical protein